MHICISKLTIIGSDNGLPPGWHKAIIWPNAGILLIGSLGTNFSEILIKIHTFSFKKMQLKMSSGKWRPFCLGLNVLKLLCFCIPHRNSLSSPNRKSQSYVSSESWNFSWFTLPHNKRTWFILGYALMWFGVHQLKKWLSTWLIYITDLLSVSHLSSQTIIGT